MAVCWDASRGGCSQPASSSHTRSCSARASAEYCPCFQRARRDRSSPSAVRGPVLGPLCIRHLPLLSPGTDTPCFGVGVGQQLLDPVTPGKKKSRAKLLPQKEGRTPCWDRSCRLDPHTHLLALFDHSSWTVYFPTVLVFQAQMSPISPFESSYQP